MCVRYLGRPPAKLASLMAMLGGATKFLYRLSADCQPSESKVVAGAGFEPATFGL